MDPIKPLVDALHAEGRLRIWSLVITVFGDSVQHRGGRVSGVRLQRLLGRVGVEPGALRTALSRLRREGWLRGTRSGRTSIYQLTDTGQARFADATGRIYAPPRAQPVTLWDMAVARDGPGVAVAPGVFLRPADDEAAAPGDVILRGEIVAFSPDARDRVCPPAHRAALAALFGDLNALPAEKLAPLDAAAARTLLVHRWRRLVLRYPELPGALMPVDAPPDDPRAAVARAYQALTPAAEAWLDSAGGEMEAMPAATADPTQRFMPAYRA